ncbi:helix-turn-helix domain-containing protein [Fictibacillus sp. WQ 8-8]|uniref:helix-turn-helix domain-containing protein n=1 Tax=Fictibacillus sp. WQ 8-8 TaxID=2938788 RepID=UPI002109080D|nr:helix-turn-helix domain-containing protein [Fictibacillus sp. WQ 8-8]MCQ6268032.1 helix-turn-helix domain-containing protein [Fictibacillus sp. WQ 8-8]
MRKLGTQIKRIRMEKGHSVTRLAEMAGISKGYLSSIENHKNNPSAHMIKKLAKALEVPVEKVINLEADPLDQEWMELVIQAKEMGINQEEIRTFIRYESWKQQTKDDEAK